MNLKLDENMIETAYERGMQKLWWEGRGDYSFLRLGTEKKEDGEYKYMLSVVVRREDGKFEIYGSPIANPPFTTREKVQHIPRLQFDSLAEGQAYVMERHGSYLRDFLGLQPETFVGNRKEKT